MDETQKSSQQYLSELRSAVEVSNVCFEQLVEAGRFNAKMLFARYESLQAAGFTKEQAFDLVKARGLS